MYFPIFVDLSVKNILIVGGGNIAARRVHTLLPFTGKLTVAAPDITEELAALEISGRITVLHRPFTETDPDGRDMVLAATDDADLNRHIAELCREKKIPVNDCSDAGQCDFHFPSVVANEQIVIGINSADKDHAAVKAVREKAEQLLGTRTLYN